MKKVKELSATEKTALLKRANELSLDEKNGESAVLEAIAKMSGTDKTIAIRLHTIIKKAAPTLTPKTWYGFPAYANKNGKVVCFFQYAGKFKTRYATLGFSDSANLDEGEMWPTAYALKKITPAEETKIVALVKQAASGN